MSYLFAYISPTERCLLDDVLAKPTYSMAKYHDAFTTFGTPQLIQSIVHGIDAAAFEADFENIGRRTFTDNNELMECYAALFDKHLSEDKAKQAKADAEEFLYRAALSNTDGMGIAWYDPKGRPVSFKSLSHPLCNPSFRSICDGTDANVCLGHVRDAALLNPREPNPVLSEYNCQPFCRGKYTFMHAGYVSDFHYLRRRVMEATGDEEVSWIKGNTDSEALAALFFTYLGEETRLGRDAVDHNVTGPVVLKRALERTVNKVLEIHGKYIADLLTGIDLKKLWDAPKNERKDTLENGAPDLERFRRSLTLSVIKDLQEAGEFTVNDLERLHATQDPRDPRRIGDMESLYADNDSDVPHTTRYSDLNIVITDGQVLVCCRFRNDNTKIIKATEGTTAVENAPRLLFSTTAGQILNSKAKFSNCKDDVIAPGIGTYPIPMPTISARDETVTLSSKDGHGAHVIVASQRVTNAKKGWEGVRKNEVIMFEPVEEEGGESKLKMVRAPLAIDPRNFV